jgi:hypothetical protein
MTDLIDTAVRRADPAATLPAAATDPDAPEARAMLAAVLSQPGPRPARHAWFRPTGRRLAVFGAAATLGAAAAVGAVLVLPVAGPAGHGSAAYAAERNPDGSVAVHVYEFTDAKGLQAKLRSLGVPATVDYVPAGDTCQPGRYHAVPAGEQQPWVEGGKPTSKDPEGARTSWDLVLYPGRLHAGESFVLTGQTVTRQDPPSKTLTDLGQVDQPVMPGAPGFYGLTIIPDGPTGTTTAVMNASTATGPVAACRATPRR